MSEDVERQWCKVIYREPDSNSTKVKQGWFSDDGSFVKVVGDAKTSLINKTYIIAIELIHEHSRGGVDES